MEQTNQYSFMTKGKSVNTNVSEIEQYLGIHMMMGIFRLPAYSNYWAVETRVNVIAATLSRKRYKDLCSSIDLVDNSLKDEKIMINCSKFDHCLKWYSRIVWKWNLKKLCQSMNKSSLLKLEGVEYNSIIPRNLWNGDLRWLQEQVHQG